VSAWGDYEVYEATAKAILDADPCCDLCAYREGIAWHGCGWLCESCWLTLKRMADFAKLKRVK
jgi:hypothetical protein